MLLINRIKYLFYIMLLSGISIGTNAEDDEGFKLKDKEGTIQYYEFSVPGLKEYMGVLKKDNPVVYNELEGEISEMNERDSFVRKTNRIVLGTSLVLGALSMIPTTIQKTERFELAGEEYYRDVEETEFKNKNLGVLALIGIISTYIISSNWGVDATEVRGFINKHNRLNTSSPLKIAFENRSQNLEPDMKMTLSYAF